MNPPLKFHPSAFSMVMCACGRVFQSFGSDLGPPEEYLAHREHCEDAQSLEKMAPQHRTDKP